MEMTLVGIPTLMQILLTTIILGMTLMDLTTLIQAIVLLMVTIQTLEVVAGLVRTMVVVMSSMVVVVAAVTILERSTFAREMINHMLPHMYHLLMTNQGMSHQIKCLVLLKVCDKYDMQILWL